MKSFLSVKRCRKAVWNSIKKNNLLSCFGLRRRTTKTKRTAENVPDGVMTVVADNLKINQNIPATTIDVGSEKEQLPAAVNSSKKEEEHINSVVQEEEQSIIIIVEAEEEGTTTTETIPNVSPGDELLDENEPAGYPEKPEIDSEHNGDADNRCQTETAPASPVLSIPLKVERDVNNNSKTRKSDDDDNDGASQHSQTTKNNCCLKAEVVDNEEAKGDFDRISYLPEPNAVLFPPERIRSSSQNRQLTVGSGLVNTGVICYINSTLQALFHIPAFTNWLMNDNAHQNACRQEAGSVNDCVVCAVRETFELSQKHTGSSFLASMIIDRLSLICKDLSTDRQEDAHEFLCYLIGSMERNCLSISEQADEFPTNVYSQKTTPVNQIFGGYIRTEVTCGECENRSITFQYFQDLILDIKQCDNVCDALKNYFESEQLSYVCDRCQREVIAEKKFSLKKAPVVLCIQLKRYDIVGMYGFYDRKIKKVMKTNEFLELSNFVCETGAQPLRYHLVSTVMHYGTSLDSGHYTAVCLTPSGSYYNFNDQNVHQTSFDKYSKSKNSYIMFYELDSLNCETSSDA